MMTGELGLGASLCSESLQGWGAQAGVGEAGALSQLGASGDCGVHRLQERRS